MDKYFSYCPESGFDTFKTEELAKKAADEAIDWFRDNSNEGWDEVVANVCWGEIKQDANMVPTNQKVELEGEMVDCYDYKLLSIDQTSDQSGAGTISEFDPAEINELFTNVRKIDHKQGKFECYAVMGLAGDLAQIAYLNNGEWRIEIDNFPRQKKYYITNLPFSSVEEFQSDMARMGIDLEMAA